jgi:pyruvate formate lyase activating enzyme
MSELVIAGLTKMSTVDWGGKIVATVFLQGCVWNCEYCHNPDLIPPRREGAVRWEEVLELLDRRQGLLDGVVFSGGEATMQDLTEAIGEVKARGFLVGLHTGGGCFVNFKKIIDLVDWVGFDIKALPQDVDKVVRTRGARTAAEKSLELLLASGKDFEVRTTYGPGIFDEAYVQKITDYLKGLGIKKHVLQRVRTQGTRESFQEKYARDIKEASRR